MADVPPLPELCCLKNSDILVHVEEALLDCLVVTYEYDSKFYQGILLDATKRALPCGVFAPTEFPESDTSENGLGIEEDKMHSVAQRYSYFQGKCPRMSKSGKDCFPPGSAYHMRRVMREGLSKFKNSRMTVRLRPRQVLCSKCKSVCNENSENVDLSKKRKGNESSGSKNGPVERRNCPSRQISPKSPRPPFSENPQDNKPTNTLASGSRKSASSSPVETASLRPSLSPKASKESEIPNLDSKIPIVGGYWTRKQNESELEVESSGRTSPPLLKASEHEETKSSLESVDDHSIKSDWNKFTLGITSSSSEERDTLSKVSSFNDKMENEADVISKLSNSFPSSETDESQDRMVLRKKRNVGSMEDLWDESVFLEDTTRRTTPVIKISFGTQGEGTVLKIPAKVRCYDESESDLEDLDGSLPGSNAKDSRTKAARKALKKAKREAYKKMPAEDNGSPSRSDNCTAYETSLYHQRRKKKVKHKKRDKGVRTQHEVNAVEEEVDFEIPPLLEDDPLRLDHVPHKESAGEKLCDYDTMKEKCLNQKLSISLKHVNAIAFSQGISSSVGSDSPGSNSELSGGDDLPDFPRPPPDDSLITAGSCLTVDGRTMEVGDVVWGKIHGFPWWPGKVLSITLHRKEGGVAAGPQAHVAWYGSSTSSLMPCDQLSPFLETFKTRYNKKKRGPYKEAIRQATCEAQKDGRDPLQEVVAVP